MDKKKDFSPTMPYLFEHIAHQYPKVCAVLENDTTYTYATLNQQINTLAHHLQQYPIKPDTLVAVAMERSVHQLIAIMAVLKAGGAYVPLDVTLPKARILTLLDDNGISYLLTSFHFKKKFTDYQGQCIFYKASDCATSELMPHACALKSSHLAYMIFTSGSTGKPKGVLIEHQSAVNYTKWFANVSHAYAGLRIDYSSNFSFDMAITNTLSALSLGLTVVICDDFTKKDLRAYLNYLHQQRIVLIKITPSYLKTLLFELDAAFIPLPYLKTIILGGESLAHETCLKWLKLYPHHCLINEYGPTETTVGAAIQCLTAKNITHFPVIPIGKPGLNMAFHLLSANQTPLGTGELGELYISGTGVARGYLNQPKLTQERFIKSPFFPHKILYRTGDICYQDEQGLFYCQGRIDDQIKLRGYRIEVAEIEQTLKQYPYIKDAVVMPYANDREEAYLVAYIILNSEHLFSEQTLLFSLKKRLPDYMLPARFMCLDKLPLTANGKLDKTALPKPINRPPAEKTMNQSTRACLLLTIWQKALGISHATMDTHFFEFGGHSLSGARVVSSIRHELGLDVTLNDLYQHPTPALLLKILAHKDSIALKKVNTITSHLRPLNEFQLTLWLSRAFQSNIKKFNVVGRKRFKGQVDKHLLHQAFACLLQKHIILHCQIVAWIPGLRLSKLPSSFKLIEHDLTHMPQSQQLPILSTSFKDLTYFYPWPKHTALIKAHVFYLTYQTWELHISLPHIIADALSLEIIFNDLSAFYLSQTLATSVPLSTYQSSNGYFSKHEITQDYKFWQKYLKDTKLVHFPKNYLISSNSSSCVNYSSYIAIPEAIINQTQMFCIEQTCSLQDTLTAALTLTLASFYEQPTPIVINRVKSIRHYDEIDKSIGCFLSLEPLKLTLKPKTILKEYLLDIQQTLADTHKHQNALTLNKLAALVPAQRSSLVLEKMLKLGLALYHCGYPDLHLNPKLSLILAKLATLNRRKDFMVTLNIWPNFLTYPSATRNTLFNMTEISTSLLHQDLVNVDYLLDVCFMRDNAYQAYLVISGNLTPKFREQLAHNIISCLNQCLVKDTQPSTPIK
ncbi:MAG: non-ribosomal peptide synthetase [Legionellaceae bacterium]|nr:non-ribosomal peptide synthetase [Legionellaceae bacterium]HCA89735.1 non-ribosomal peptide synthetase [Legionellales bacterium]|tara:strand:- start:864 stop:4094 length:3231 start_codon:yes stop_codon:yes gene_type:complete